MPIKKGVVIRILSAFLGGHGNRFSLAFLAGIDYEVVFGKQRLKKGRRLNNLVTIGVFGRARKSISL